jgi:hypothetical protein
MTDTDRTETEIAERCPKCGYSHADAQRHMDHRLCAGYPFFPDEKKSVRALSLPADTEGDKFDEHADWLDAWAEKKILISHGQYGSERVSHPDEVKAKLHAAADKIRSLPVPAEQKAVGDICLKCKKIILYCQCPRDLPGPPDAETEHVCSDACIGDLERMVDAESHRANENARTIDTLRTTLRELAGIGSQISGFADHKKACRWHQGFGCDCGFRSLQKAVATFRQQHPELFTSGQAGEGEQIMRRIAELEREINESLQLTECCSTLKQMSDACIRGAVAESRVMDLEAQLAQREEPIAESYKGELIVLRQAIRDVGVRLRKGEYCHLADHMQDMCDCKAITDEYDRLLTLTTAAQHELEVGAEYLCIRRDRKYHQAAVWDGDEWSQGIAMVWKPDALIPILKLTPTAEGGDS